MLETMIFSKNSKNKKFVLSYCLAYFVLYPMDKDNKYSFCEKTLELCIEWYRMRKLDIEILYEQFSNEDYDIFCIMDEIKDEKLKNQFGIILTCIGYMTAASFDEEKYIYPEDLEGYDDDCMDELVLFMKQEGLLLSTQYDKLLMVSDYLIEKDDYSNKESMIKSCLI